MAYDSENVFYAALTSLCYPCNDLKTVIERPHEKKEMTIKEAVYFNDHFMEEMGKAANKMPSNGVTIEAGKPFRTIKEQRNHAYEKTYEWKSKNPSPRLPYRSNSKLV